MLAKMWKKLLLAICIIAILFNVMYKIVHRSDLKEQMQSVMGGNIIEFSTEEEDTNKVEENNK